MTSFTETLYDAYAQQFSIDEVYLEQRTEHQHLLIFHNAMFGRVMALDGVVQTTEKDEFVYHEMLTHVPLFAHGEVKSVLIVGGGDGGTLREVVRHRGIERINLVEIDREVIATCRRYLPTHSQGAFDDPRVTIIIQDGMDFVRRSDQTFDVIISDSPDPIGPGEVLFSSEFYSACKQRLDEGGVLVTQNGVAFVQLDEVQTTADRLRPLFQDWHFYGAAVPTYIGGVMTFAWASDDASLRRVPLSTLRQRYIDSGLTTRYYNPEIHQAAFALPQYILDAIGK